MTRLYLSILSFLVSLSGFAQSEPFKKANTIQIETGLPAAEVYKAWGQHLAANGFTIDKSDATFYTIATGPKDTSKLNLAFVVNSAVLDSGTVLVKMKIQVKSSILTNTAATDFSDWQYGGMKGSPNQVVYQDIMKIITSFGQHPVTYLVK